MVQEKQTMHAAGAACCSGRQDSGNQPDQTVCAADKKCCSGQEDSCVRLKQTALAAIEVRADKITDVADQIWEYAELSLQEEKSAALY